MELNYSILMTSHGKIPRKFNEQRHVQQFVIKRKYMINLAMLSQEFPMIACYNEKGIIEHALVF
jgi:hypothetical protein